MNSLRKTGTGWGGVIRGPRGGVYHLNALGNKISGPPPQGFTEAKKISSIEGIIDKHTKQAKLGRMSQDGRSVTVVGHGVVGHVLARQDGSFVARNLLRENISEHKTIDEAKRAVLKKEIERLVENKRLRGKHDHNTPLTADI